MSCCQDQGYLPENIVPTIGQEVPDFEFTMFHEGEAKQSHFSHYRGKWTIFVFYPADFTFICPTELEDLADHYPEFQKLDAEVFGVSTDKVETHKAWHDHSPAIKKVQYPLIADPTGNITREFGVYIEEEGVARRGTFIVDPDGVLRTIEIHDNNIGRDAKELIRKLQAAQFVRQHGGQVCPAKWKPGEKTLKPGLDLVGKI